MIGSASKERLFAAAIDSLVASLLALAIGKFVSDSRLLLWTMPGVAFLGYYLLFEAATASTPGKLLFGLRVISLDGSRFGFQKAAARTLLRLLEVNPILLGGLPAGLAIALSKHHQRLGDRIAGTIVTKKAPISEQAMPVSEFARGAEIRAPSKPLATAIWALVALAALLAIALVPTRSSRADLFAEASSLIAEGSHAAAVEVLNKALDVSGSVPDSEVQYLLATAYMKLRRVSEAEATLESAIASDPAAARPLVLLGGIRKEQGMYREARELFEQAVAAEPDYYNAHAGLGSIDLLEGDFPSAIGHLEAAAELEPSGRHTWPTLAIAYAYNGQFEEAWDAAKITRAFDYIEQHELEELIRGLQSGDQQ